MKSAFLLVLLFIISMLCSSNCNKKLTTTDVIKEKGYPVEEYTVETEDGYLLQLYRIPRGINSNNNTNSGKNNRKVVLLVHGLLANAGSFIVFTRSLGYFLADNEYDVWLLDSRGTSGSNKHINLDPQKDSKEFYNFSWHEMGFYDVPATIDFILNKTNQNQLQYIGHSQGTGAFLVMTSMRPEYNSKIRLANLLAPPIFMRTHINPLFKFFSLFQKPVHFLTNLLNIYNLNLFHFVDVVRDELKSTCSHENFYSVCMIIIDLLVGYHDPVQLHASDLPVITQLCPSDASLKQLYHFNQLINTGTFRQFDYGDENNLIVYGSKTPPDYNLDNVKSPVALYVGENDHFSNPKDVKLLGNNLQNLTKFQIIDWRYFNHVDFIMAVDLEKLLYKDLLTHMSLYSVSD